MFDSISELPELRCLLYYQNLKIEVVHENDVCFSSSCPK